MAAEIIEQQETDENLDQLPTDAEAKSPEQIVEELSGVDTTQQETPQAAEEELPEKYRNKSVKDIVAMHQEAEKLIGKHSSEVGELRGIVDGFIQGQLQGQSHTQQEPQVEEVDFFEDPEKAVRQAIETHPDVIQSKQDAEAMRKQQALSQLQQKHTDLGDVLGNPQFVEWVKASPIRTELFQRADSQYDFQAADELVSTFKERSGVAQQTLQQEEQTRKQQVQQASTGSVRGSTDGGGSKRIYRRADIIKLMKTDPDRYDALSNEILQAYAEGRVR